MATGRGSRVVLLLVKLLSADRLLGDLGEFDQEVDDLFLEDRGSHGRERLRVVSIMVPDLLLAAGKLTRALCNPAGKLVFGNLEAVLLADFGKHQAEPHGPL